ncbi:hypothetical protein D3C77_695830 [compost metagenome]
MHLVRVWRQILQEGSVLSAARTVQQRPGFPSALAREDHAQERGDADAAGNEHMRRCLGVQAEPLAGFAHAQDVAYPYRFVDMARSAA